MKQQKLDKYSNSSKDLTRYHESTNYRTHSRNLVEEAKSNEKENRKQKRKAAAC